MRDVALRALDTARLRGAAYADVRIVHHRSETVAVRNRNVEGLVQDESLGFGVRVLVDGYWGFAGSNNLTTAEADRVAAEAVKIARASAIVAGRKADLGPPVRPIGRYVTPVLKDPFAVPIEAKIALLLRTNEAMLAVPAVVKAESTTYCQRETKTFASSEGAYVEQDLYETGCGIEATTVDEGEVQNRSYPNSVGRHQGTEGWEFVERWDLAANAPRVAEEAAALLTAKPCPAGVTTVILDGSRSPSRSTRAAATPSSSTASSAVRPPSPAPASSLPTSSAPSATAPISSTSPPTQRSPAASAASPTMTRASPPSARPSSATACSWVT